MSWYYQDTHQKVGLKLRKFFTNFFKFYFGGGLEALLPRYLFRYPHLYNY